MINSGNKSPLKFFFGAPSCVPAASFETSGAILGEAEIGNLLKRSDIHFLGEVMNFPGVIAGDKEMLLKLEHAKKMGKPIDGHAPFITGSDLKKYVDSGITTEHECSLLEEAREKANAGLKIIIREGSAAKNLKILMPLIDEKPE